MPGDRAASRCVNHAMSALAPCPKQCGQSPFRIRVQIFQWMIHAVLVGEKCSQMEYRRLPRRNVSLRQVTDVALDECHTIVGRQKPLVPGRKVVYDDYRRGAISQQPAD